MFGKLQGVVEYIGNNFVILSANGVGFKVLLPANILSAQVIGKESTFWIETIVREDSISLIGFDNMEEQDLFTKLTSVSGIGTKVALVILGNFKVNVLQSAIANGDVKTLWNNKVDSFRAEAEAVAENMNKNILGK